MGHKIAGGARGDERLRARPVFVMDNIILGENIRRFGERFGGFHLADGDGDG